MSRSSAPALLLASPALANANNGNWRTAARWARLLAPHYRVIVQAASDPVDGMRRDNAVALIALHARYGHAAALAWKAAHPDRPLIVVLTGTDLYRDIRDRHLDALASLALADRLIVLQDDAPLHLPPAARAKTHVVFQSARVLTPWHRKSKATLNCLLVAHLRPEKDPLTALRAWTRLPKDLPATLTVVGAALDPALGIAVRDAAAHDARIVWLGPKPHAWVRQAIKRAHLLLVPSRMEGGANVIVEALTAGTAVLGSRMSGNLGMLGAAHPGYFPVGDAAALAALIERSHRERSFLESLTQHGELRAPLFTPEVEARALAKIISDVTATDRTKMTA